MQELKTWTEDKEEFITGMADGEWIITQDNRLLHARDAEADRNYSHDENFKDSVLVIGLAHHHTSDWLRFFCEEHHPEIDFDKEFESNKPGVLARYQEKFPKDDHQTWAAEKQYKRPRKELHEKGYILSFD